MKSLDIFRPISGSEWILGPFSVIGAAILKLKWLGLFPAAFALWTLRVNIDLCSLELPARSLNWVSEPIER